MSQATLQRLDELLRKSAYYYNTGALNKYFISLKNTKLQSMFKFKEVERKKLNNIEKAFKDAKDKNKKWGLAELYSERLLDCMNKYGLLLPDKTDDSNTSY